MTKVSFRANDYEYDPLFKVSGQKDFLKAAMIAKISTAKFQVCPIFNTMFSDLPYHTRNEYVMRESKRVKSRTIQLCESTPNTKIDIKGADRFRFFTIPVAQNVVPKLQMQPPNTPISDEIKITKKKSKNKRMQTEYRESSAQTSPWQPDFEVMDGSDPEILKLDFLKWHSGLPAGMHEVILIERARMKRAWEAAMPEPTDKASLEKRSRIIEAMELDEWAFREQEIQDIQDMRMELLERMLQELHEKSQIRTETKLKSFCQLKQKEKEEKISKLRHSTERELRKLKMKHLGVEKKYHVENIITEHGDRKSELYGPCMRHGEHPKRWHAIIDERLKQYRSQFIGVEALSTLPRWLDQAVKLNERDLPKLPGRRLCLRETKWTTPILKLLHEELKNLRTVRTKRYCSLKVRIEQAAAEIPTPEVEGIVDQDENLYQAIILMQAIMRGRAAQLIIYNGRDRCRELIQELRSTHGLERMEKIKKFQEKVDVENEQRNTLECMQNKKVIEELLKKFHGIAIGSLLDFLHKELRRLLDERRTHALCMIAERERLRREAAEAGRRQKELRRRSEHDEMFKQIVKLRQETVDLYLQDIVTEGMDFASVEEAENYVKKLAEKIDEEANASIIKRPTNTEEEELVADLIHHFIIPEAEKEVVRHRAKMQMKKYLHSAHHAIYGAIEKLPPPEIKPRRRKRKIVEQQEKEEEESTDSGTTTSSSYMSSSTNSSDDSIGLPTDLLADKPTEPLQLLFTRDMELDTPSAKLSIYADRADRITIITVDTLYHFLKRTDGIDFIPTFDEQTTTVKSICSLLGNMNLPSDLQQLLKRLEEEEMRRGTQTTISDGGEEEEDEIGGGGGGADKNTLDSTSDSTKKIVLHDSIMIYKQKDALNDDDNASSNDDD